MKNYFHFFTFFFFTGCFAQSVVIYPPPLNNFEKISDKYLITIVQNGISKNSVVYKSSAGSGSKREWGKEQSNNFHFTTFSFSGTVTVEVVKMNSLATQAIVRPFRTGIGSINTLSQNADRKITFKLNKPAKISVEFDDDPSFKDALAIFADKLEDKRDIPEQSNESVFLVRDSTDFKNIPINKDVVYFKPGKYNIGYWNIPRNIKQVYLDGGAYVQGYLDNESGNSIKINGRGILSNEGYSYHYPSKEGIEENASKNWYFPIKIKGGGGHIIEGITIIEATGYNIVINANNAIVQNVKISGFRYNNDGITISGTGNKIENCFVRVNDDAIVVYASNLIVSDCVFWQLQGSVFQLGWTAHSMEDITISNCDVIHDQAEHSDENVGFINAMNSRRSNQVATIKDVNVNNIYFDTPIIRLLDIRRDRNIKDSASGSLPWVYKNFHFSSIHFGQRINKYPLIYLYGYSSSFPLSNFTFKNLYDQDGKILKGKISNNSFMSTKNIVATKIN